mgnify:CR=1 FL=1
MDRKVERRVVVGEVKKRRRRGLVEIQEKKKNRHGIIWMRDSESMVVPEGHKRFRRLKLISQKGRWG